MNWDLSGMIPMQVKVKADDEPGMIYERFTQDLLLFVSTLFFIEVIRKYKSI